MSKIILDDVLETLDEANIQAVIKHIKDITADVEIEILTHSSYTHSLVVKYLREIGTHFTVHKMNKTPSGFRVSVKPIETSEIHTFISNIVNGDHKNKKIKDSILLLKAFNRINHHEGMTADMSHKKMGDSWGLQYWNFSSENIFHYEEHIKKSSIKNMLGIKVGQKSINSIELLKMISDELGPKNFNGIDLKKVRAWIKEIINYLKIERDSCYPEWVKDKTIKKDSVAESFWPTKASINKIQRDEIAHRFENDFSSLSKS